MNYRKEIDGLRGVAVSSVILFHAGFSIFRGGYVGVDVFFVISGFLITGISLNSYNNRRFSVLSFFERRARRILPALAFVLFMSTLAAVTILDPFELTNFFESLVSTFLFVSNFYFMFQSGYFDTASELKPLLHTWSLSVEEQYYIIFPFAFLLLVRLGGRAVLSIIIFVFVSSIVFSQILLSLGFVTEAFYLLPSRIWQILVGVLCAIIIRTRFFENPHPKIREVASSIGLLLIVGAVLFFNNNTPSPGPHALVPTIGAAMLLLFAGPETFCGKLLGLKPLVFLGLISYSAYLWHQPLFAFARISVGEEPEALIFIVLCALVVVLSFFSWKFVETPFRSVNIFSTKRFVIASASVVVVSISIGLSGVYTNGFLNQIYSKEKIERYSMIIDAINYDYIENMYDNQDCKFWSKDVSEAFVLRFQKCSRKYGAGTLILGDSHGQNFYNIAAKTDVSHFVVGGVQEGCRPHKDKVKDCQYENFLRFVDQEKDSIRKIIFHQSGSHLTKRKEIEKDNSLNKQIEFDVDSDGVMKVVNYLKNLSSAYEGGIIWLGPFIEYQRLPMSAGKSDAALTVNPNSPKMIETFDSHMAKLVLPKPIEYIPFSSQFDSPRYAIINNCFVFRDGDHFSRCGEDLIAQKVAKGETILDSDL